MTLLIVDPPTNHRECWRMSGEAAIKAGLIIIGDELEIKRDVCVLLRDGRVEGIERIESCPRDAIGSSELVITPQPALAHVHSGDHAFPEYGVDIELSKLVAPPDGLKHRMLNTTPLSELEKAILEYYRLAWRYGVGLLIDFREGGGVGCSISKKALDKAPEGIQVVVLGRPGPGFPDGCDGLGLSSPLDYPPSELRRMVGNLRPAFTHVAETESARIQGDLERAIEASFNAVIHGTYLSVEDLEKLHDNNISLILCPRSNLWHGLGLPPVREAYSILERIGLGSDNASWMTPDPWREAETALLLARLKGPTGEWLAEKILRSLFIDPYYMIGSRPKIISEGGEANFLVFDASVTGLLRSDSVKYGLLKRIGGENLVARVDRGEISFL